jgi:hypothetical protein
MKFALMLLIFGAASTVASAETVAVGDAEGWKKVGVTRFERCEFGAAAHAFSKALQYLPKDARLHHWLGKSYARLAEIANPLRASKDARKAQVSLERAVELEPANQEYLRELFDFYLDSPEWFGGGLERASLLIERIEPDDPAGQKFLRELVAGARQEHRGLDWRLRQLTLVPTQQMGRVTP